MSARSKLNVAYFNGRLLVAVLFGLAAQSWAVFRVALAVTICRAVHGGEIRPTTGKR